MAKGLFSVYSDVPSTSATTTAAPKRRGLSSSSGLTSSSSLAYNKENVNPFALHAAAHGKPGLAVKAKAKSINKPSSASLAACSSFTKATYNPPALKAIVASTASANQICTGTLRTRVLPSPIRPPTPSSPAFSSLSLSTPRSATDSGYARSVSPDSLAEDAADEEECEIAEMDRYEMERETAGDRRARALTESPLAEVTQAYTSRADSAFCLPSNAPGSPSPLSSTFSGQAQAEITMQKVAAAKAPSEIAGAGAGYSTTRTTRKAKPAPSGSVPLTAGGLRY